MPHFAQIDGNNKVVRVIVAEEDFIKSGAVGKPASWVQTSYNTRGGIHYGPDGEPDDGVPLRANFASVGDTYDRKYDVFYSPKPTMFPSFVIKPPTWQWEPPKPKPESVNGENYIWDEKLVKWVVEPEPEPEPETPPEL